MNEIEEKFQFISIYSLPKILPKKMIEFGIKGDEKEVTVAMEYLKENLNAKKIKWRKH